MSFAVSGGDYGRFMGRYSEQLAPAFADLAGVAARMRVLDVGCGPGALTAELARRVGAERVAAADPAEHFVEACRARVPGADVRVAPAEALPFEDGSFDAALAQLVFSFVPDAPAGAAEMRRVVSSGGAVAGCMWAAGDGMEMLRTFWGAAAALVDSDAGAAESRMRYRTREELEELAESAGLTEVKIERLAIEARYEDFDDFWDPVASAPGPVGGSKPASTTISARRSARSAAGGWTTQAGRSHWARRPGRSAAAPEPRRN